jgi:uncharacterized protein YrrD
LLVDKAGWFHNARVLPLQEILFIGEDEIGVPTKSVILEAKQLPAIQLILERRNTLDGTTLTTSDGEEIGIIQDIQFDERSGNVEGFMVTSRVTDETWPETWFLPCGEEVWIGESVAIVGAELIKRLRQSASRGQSGDVSKPFHHRADSIPERTAGDEAETVTPPPEPDQRDTDGQTAIGDGDNEARANYDEILLLRSMAPWIAGTMLLMWCVSCPPGNPMWTQAGSVRTDLELEFPSRGQLHEASAVPKRPTLIRGSMKWHGDPKLSTPINRSDKHGISRKDTRSGASAKTKPKGEPGQR